MPGPIGMGHEAPAFFDVPGPDLNERHSGNIRDSCNIAICTSSLNASLRRTSYILYRQLIKCLIPHCHSFLSSHAIIHFIQYNLVTCTLILWGSDNPKSQVQSS